MSTTPPPAAAPDGPPAPGPAAAQSPASASSDGTAGKPSPAADVHDKFYDPVPPYTRPGPVLGTIFGHGGGLPSALVSFVNSTVEPVLEAMDPLLPFQNLFASSVVLGTMFATWCLAQMKAGLGWYFLLVLFLGGIYRRNHQSLRMRIAREFVKQGALMKLNEDAESVNWLNLFLAKFWVIYEPGLSLQIKETIDSVLASSKPNFLNELRLVKFTLGSNPPRIDSIRTYPGSDADVLVMDWDLFFTPFDVDGLSEREKASSGVYNFYMELVARVGAGAASLPLTVLLKEFSLSGKLRISLKFVTAFPHIGAVEFGFLEVPSVDFILRPLKGLDLNDIPGLSTFLQDTINEQLKAAIVNPNKIPINLEEMMTADGTDRPIGILRVTILNARELRNVDITGTSDPCAIVMIGGKEVARTAVIDNSLNPVWNETFNLIVFKSMFSQLANRSDEIKFEVMHHNPLQKKLIGSTSTVRLQRWARLLDPTSVDELPEEIPAELKRDPMRPMTRSEHDWLLTNWGTPLGEPSEVIKPLLRPNSNKSAGSLRLDMAYFPIPETPSDVPVNSRTGVFSVTVHQAKDLATSKNGAPECVLELDGIEIGRTPPKKHTNNPTWYYIKDAFCQDIDVARMRISVLDGSRRLGDCTVNARDLIGPEKEDWFKLYNVTSGKVRITAKFTPVDMLHLSTDTSKMKRKEPCGLLRINMRKAENLANVEVLRKSDPYVKVNTGGKPFGATHVRPNTLDPEWNEIFYCIVTSPKDPILLEVFDWNELRNDKKLGKVEINLDLILPNNPHFEGKKSDGKASEVAAALTADGLEIKPVSETYAEVRAPLYISKSLEVPNSTANADSQNESESETVEPKEKKSGFLRREAFKKPSKSFLGVGGASKVRQRGHIYFDVEYFPVVTDMIVKPISPQQVLRSRASVIGAAGTETSPSGTLPRTVTRSESKATITAAGATADAAAAKAQPANTETKTQDAATAAKAGTAGADAPPSPTEVANALAEHDEAIREQARSVVGKYQSGVLRIRVRGAKLCRAARAYLELLVDGTTIFRTRTSEETLEPMWLEAADKFVMDIASSSFMILIRQQLAEERTSNDFILGTWVGDAVLDLIGHSYDRLAIRQFTQASRRLDELPYVAHLSAEFGYSPVSISLAAGSKFNSGVLNIDIVEAKNLMSADTNGFSDPYCVVNLNGSRIHKTKVLKRTLNPVFNESIQAVVKSRLRSTVEVQLMDWDALGGHDFLGRVVIHLAHLPADEVVNKVYAVEDGEGTLTLRLLFQPQAIDEDGSQLDAEARLEGSGSKVGLSKIYRGLTASFANSNANSFISGMTKRGMSGGVTPAAPSGPRYTLEGQRARENTGLSKPSGGDAAAPAQPAPAAPAARELPRPPRPQAASLSGQSTDAVSSTANESKASLASTASDQPAATPAVPPLPSQQSAPSSLLGVPQQATPRMPHEPASASSDSASDLAATIKTAKSGPAISVRAPSPSEGRPSDVRPSVDEFRAQVSLEIVQASGLRAVDSTGTSDPYVKVMQMRNGELKQVHKTAVVKRNTSPVWSNEVFTVQCPPPTIRLIIKDHNTFKQSTELGQVGLDLFGLLQATGLFDTYFPVDGGTGQLRVRGTIVGSPSPDGSDTASTLEKKRTLFGFKKSLETIGQDGRAPSASGNGLFGSFRRPSGGSVASSGQSSASISRQPSSTSIAEGTH
ncbi:Tricalbin-2 [Polyrhizophydium stewartii]|uniref:Tricalbin-2 n=1 Tax=Polyrhizophydium stewartii TaxID=2732419 RepID=A0ABR4N295_9FUNG